MNAKEPRGVLNKIQAFIEYGNGATESELKSLWNDLSIAITELESKLSQPILTDKEIEIEAEKYTIKRHGLGEEWQPDRLESMFSFAEGAKFFRDKQIGNQQ